MDFILWVFSILNDSMILGHLLLAFEVCPCTQVYHDTRLPLASLWLLDWACLSHQPGTQWHRYLYPLPYKPQGMPPLRNNTVTTGIHVSLQEQEGVCRDRQYFSVMLCMFLCVKEAICDSFCLFKEFFL